MKAVILAGGFGTRISEESAVRPKPMVEIGGRPILWHIMKIYAAQGVTDFIVCCGYKGWFIKEYFANYDVHSCDLTVDLANGVVTRHPHATEPWTVSLIDTGEATMTGGRLRRVRHLLGDETFFMTYGDGVSDVSLSDLLDVHRARPETLATLTAVQPPGRFGAIGIVNGVVQEMVEKPIGDGGWVNGGFFAIEPATIDFIEDDSTVFEHDVLPALAGQGLLAAHNHRGYWQNMDTLRDRAVLEERWEQGDAPWRIW